MNTTNNKTIIFGNPLLHKLFLRIGSKNKVTSIIQALSNIFESSKEHDIEVTVELEKNSPNNIRSLSAILENRNVQRSGYEYRLPKDHSRWRSGHEYRLPRFRVVIDTEIDAQEIYDVIKEFDIYYPEIEVLLLESLDKPFNQEFMECSQKRIKEYDDSTRGSFLILFNTAESISFSNYSFISEAINVAHDKGLNTLLEINPAIMSNFSEIRSIRIEGILKLLVDSKVRLFDCGLLSIADRIVQSKEFLFSPNLNCYFRCGAATFSKSLYSSRHFPA
ncbi:MAG: hypothetical protein ACFFD4_33105, partial [Candidatus Odinarchaeota archaeon]